MEQRKKIFVSGKLSGTHTYKDDLISKENPDNIEKFLLDFCDFKLSKDMLAFSNIQEITDDNQALEMIKNIESPCKLGIYFNKIFKKAFLSFSENKNIIISINGFTIKAIFELLSNSEITKYIINSFSTLNWIKEYGVEIKSLYDIPTFIKLLTNRVDPYKPEMEYLKEYTDYGYDNSENDEMTVACFCRVFGQILDEKSEEFGLLDASKAINENNEYELMELNKIGEQDYTILEIAYNGLKEVFSERNIKDIKQFESKAYVLSPLKRIIPKYKNYNKEIAENLESAYLEDLTLKTLNELYNNNLPVKYDFENEKYIIFCKAKNLNNIFSVTQAVFTQVFSGLFDKMPHLKIECDVMYE